MSRSIPECRDCHAQLQTAMIEGEIVWRCPWAKVGARPRAGEGRIECGRPYAANKHPDGLALRSVQ